MSNIVERLRDALVSYIRFLTTTEHEHRPVEEVRPSSEDYSGVGFVWRLHGDWTEFEGRVVVALMSDIDLLFERIGRYTSQKSRFIMTGGGSVAMDTHTDLYAFTRDEYALYRQFLREGSDRLFGLFSAYNKGVPFRGYLFDEGVDVVTQGSDEVSGSAWPADSFVRVSGVLYRAVQDVPAGISIDDREYWGLASSLYDTRGKIVYFVGGVLDSFPANSLMGVIQSVENYLYSFVLWRWYVLAGLLEEASAWSSSSQMYSGDVRRFLTHRMFGTTRGQYPW
jgi:hypothetical protein